MAYAIHVRRRDEDAGITLEEWLAAVAASPSARIMTTPLDLGRGVMLSPAPGDVELFSAKEQRWIPVFQGTVLDDNELYISTRAEALESPEVLAFLCHAKTMLDAVVTGDDGEEYDVTTGQPLG